MSDRQYIQGTYRPITDSCLTLILALQSRRNTVILCFVQLHVRLMLIIKSLASLVAAGLSRPSFMNDV